MTKILTTQNAQITTAAVEVKTLTISGKQVTLSVFRQLREERLMNPDASLNGAPWGYVNYHPDKCGTEKTHLHVVWQNGADLYRSRVDKPDWHSEHYHSEWSDDLIQGAYCANEHRLPAWAREAQSWDSGYKRWDQVVRFTIDGISCETMERPTAHWREGEKCVSTAAQAEDREGFMRELAEEAEKRGRLTAQWKLLADLPHLFIAV